MDTPRLLLCGQAPPHRGTGSRLGALQGSPEQDTLWDGGGPVMQEGALRRGETSWRGVFSSGFDFSLKVCPLMPCPQRLFRSIWARSDEEMMEICLNSQMHSSGKDLPSIQAIQKIIVIVESGTIYRVFKKWQAPVLTSVCKEVVVSLISVL